MDAIKGYRNLSPAEVALINRIKAHGEATETLLAEVREVLNDQTHAAYAAAPGKGCTPEQAAEQARLNYATPRRWLAIAQTDLQTGAMALVRAVAQPGTF